MESKQSLEILIGDDMFLMPVDAMMAQNQYLEPLKERIPGYDVRLSYASTPEEMLTEASRGTYDVIISDLDYGTTGRMGTEGFDVCNGVNKMNLSKKPFLVLCTSRDDVQKQIKKLLYEGKIGAVVTPKSKHKFNALAEFLEEKYI
ncbi:hypothetical protein J4461_00030 [Candidatus Pacearchaeota archaeon]|nr:hypothetical protein [Candidatus Pacearchaeota archaeon]